MRSRVGQLAVEITRPESAKFRHPLLLLHGRWTGAWIWERLAPLLAHRGWESWAPSLLEAAVPESFEAALDCIEGVARAMPAAPILLTHDTGLTFGTALSAHVEAPALVGLAPFVPGPSPIGRGLIRIWPERWRRARVPPPRGSAAAALVGRAAEARRRLVADSGPVLRALAAGRVAISPASNRPGLLLAGEQDPISPPAAIAALAERFGWEVRCYAAHGHLMQLEHGFEQIGADLHRWIIRALGADLLALLEDAGES